MLCASAATVTSFLWGKLYFQEPSAHGPGAVVGLVVLLVGICGISRVLWHRLQTLEQAKRIAEGNSLISGLVLAAFAGMFGGSCFAANKILPSDQQGVTFVWTQALGMLGPHARKFFDPSFVKERTQFVSKQPGHVKVTMRLMKWWRDQQAWSCSLTRPSDYVLELIVIYAAQQCGKVTQAQAVANCMSLLSRFDQLRVVWSNYYDPSDVWSPLMLQKPLLMDPVNPFTNVADPQDFDARELMSLASSTHFFW